MKFLQKIRDACNRLGRRGADGEQDQVTSDAIRILLLYFFKKYFIFRERGRERKREGEKHQRVRETSIVSPQLGILPTTQARGLTGN